MNLETSRPNVPGPCGGCPQARECCSDVTLTFTPDKAELIPDWFLSHPNVRVVRKDELGGMTIEVGKSCPAFNELTWECNSFYEDWLSRDCSMFPLNNDGEKEPRTTCPRWDEFPERLINQVVYDTELALPVVR